MNIKFFAFYVLLSSILATSAFASKRTQPDVADEGTNTPNTKPRTELSVTEPPRDGLFSLLPPELIVQIFQDNCLPRLIFLNKKHYSFVTGYDAPGSTGIGRGKTPQRSPLLKCDELNRPRLMLEDKKANKRIMFHIFKPTGQKLTYTSENLPSPLWYTFIKEVTFFGSFDPSNRKSSFFDPSNRKNAFKDILSHLRTTHVDSLIFKRWSLNNHTLQSLSLGLPEMPSIKKIDMGKCRTPEKFESEFLPAIKSTALTDVALPKFSGEDDDAIEVSLSELLSHLQGSKVTTLHLSHLDSNDAEYSDTEGDGSSREPDLSLAFESTLLKKLILKNCTNLEEESKIVKLFRKKALSCELVITSRGRAIASDSDSDGASDPRPQPPSQQLINIAGVPFAADSDSDGVSDPRPQPPSQQLINIAGVPFAADFFSSMIFHHLPQGNDDED
jgi:hypothetical protein